MFFNACKILLSCISANLGVMNLLPIPALDGGRLLFLLIEAVLGQAGAKRKRGNRSYRRNYFPLHFYDIHFV